MVGTRSDTCGGRRILAGCGFALVYPALGVEAVRRVPPQGHGLAMGAYTAFLDVAVGFGSPTLGLIAGSAGLRAVFLAAALIVLCAAAIALRLLYAPQPVRDPDPTPPVAGRSWPVLLRRPRNRHRWSLDT